MSIGKVVKKVREKLKLTQVELSKLTGINVKTIYEIENSKRKPNKRTMAKIRKGIIRRFGLDIYKMMNYKAVWEKKDLSVKTLSLVEGGLLGDGSIPKSGIYTQQAKDKKYLKWLADLLLKGGMHCKVVSAKHRNCFSSSHNFWQLYSHSCPAFLDIRKKWYSEQNGKFIKRVPADIKITPTTLLHWYLDDGDFKRDRRRGKIGRPCIRLSTNNFIREDIESLIEKLKELGLEFYPIPKLNEKRESGYILYLYVKDMLKFFKLIGFEPIDEIKDGITKIVKNRKIYTFKGKWPTKSDWIRILAKVDGIGKIIKGRRKELNLSQKELANKVGVKKHQICEIECGRKYTSLKRFERFLEVLNLDVYDILKKLV